MNKIPMPLDDVTQLVRGKGHGQDSLYMTEH